jgi:hypothetical protein
MKKQLILVVSLALASLVTAQEIETMHPTKASREYRKYREATSEPTFSISKVKAIIKKIKKDQDDNRRLAEKDFNALSLEQKFTYTMIHGEDSTQNCDAPMGIVDEEKKIFSYIPSAFGDEVTWSDRQRDFLTKNRSKVIPLIKETLKLRRRAGVNLKNAILETNAVELIPDLVSIYRIHNKDHDILTVLMLLMKEGNYPEFMKSTSFTKLYGENANYKSFLQASAANQKLIIDRAMAFYKSSQK